MKTTIELKNNLKEQGLAIRALKNDIRSKRMASYSEWKSLRDLKMSFRIDHIIYTLVNHGKLNKNSSLIKDDLFDIRLGVPETYSSIIELGIEKENSSTINYKLIELRLNELINKNFITREGF